MLQLRFNGCNHMNCRLVCPRDFHVFSICDVKFVCFQFSQNLHCYCSFFNANWILQFHPLATWFSARFYLFVFVAKFGCIIIFIFAGVAVTFVTNVELHILGKLIYYPLYLNLCEISRIIFSHDFFKYF